MVGCTSPTETESATGDIKVQIPVRENDQPQLKVVTLHQIEDLRRVLGGHAIFYYAPKIEDSLVMGEVPHARFTKMSGDVFVPANRQSAEMAAIYYHLQNLSAFDAVLGLADLNVGPRKVAISTRILKSNMLVRDNSFYDQNSDAMIFVDFESMGFPLTLNSGVIAHEHFHSIFSKLVILPLVKAGRLSESLKVSSHRTVSKISNSSATLESEFTGLNEKELKRNFQNFILLKALNEGLADYWGWHYSKNEKFVSISIPGETGRSLEEPAYGFPSQKIRNEQIDSMFDLYLVAKDKDKDKDKEKALEEIQDWGGRYAYSLGNQYARFFRNLSKTIEGQDLDPASQNILPLRLIFMLNDLREKLLNNQTQQMIQPENVIESFCTKNSDLFKKDCRLPENLLQNNVTVLGEER